MADELGKALLKQVRGKLEYYKKNVSTRIEVQMEDDLDELRQQIVSQFYDYSPSQGDENRTGALWNAIKVKPLKNGAMLYLDASEMSGDYGEGSYTVTGDYVLDLIWFQGVRGLPEYGTKPLKETYNFAGNEFKEGSYWYNPFWDPDVYHNIFEPTVKIGKYTSKPGATPAEIANDFVNSWGKYRMDDVFNKAIMMANKG